MRTDPVGQSAFTAEEIGRVVRTRRLVQQRAAPLQGSPCAHATRNAKRGDRFPIKPDIAARPMRP